MMFRKMRAGRRLLSAKFQNGGGLRPVRHLYHVVFNHFNIQLDDHPSGSGLAGLDFSDF